MEFKSSCRACGHLHLDYICNWQVRKTGRISLKPYYSVSLWGIENALHIHSKDDQNKDVIYSSSLNTYKNETFEYEQETDCGCKCYTPSDNLEFMEWKYEQST